MFDPVTRNIIEDAPPREGLDSKDLPKILTRAFAEIVAARIRLQGQEPSSEDISVTDSIALLRRIAATNEAYAALLKGRKNRASAAFVAATAHQTISMFERNHAEQNSYVDLCSISSDISCALLFLLSDAQTDAAEVAKRIAPRLNADPTEAALLIAIRNLALGQYSNILTSEEPDQIGDGQDSVLSALHALQFLLLRGIKRLARDMSSGPRLPKSKEHVKDSESEFSRVRDLAVERIELEPDSKSTTVSVFSGPLHLANLLIGLRRCLLESRLVDISTPTSVNGVAWRRFLSGLARRRPIVWRNHRTAISEGFLNQGISSAVSFPTGAGKSTLTELKIATSLLRRERVVFLAPTHALIAQTRNSLQKTFYNVSIQADFRENIEERVDFGNVTVMTPERCQFSLSVEPEEFESVGLVVFDECHLLQTTADNGNRRGIDSMLALINLTRTARNADLLLLSAMMKNTREIADWIEDLTKRKCLALDLEWKPTRQIRGCVLYREDTIKALQTKLTRVRRENPSPNTRLPANFSATLLAQQYGLFGLHQTWMTEKQSDYALFHLHDYDHQFNLGKGVGGSLYLTPNGNVASSKIAQSAAQVGIKTLVFVNGVKDCESCVKKFPEPSDSSRVQLTTHEAKLRRLSEEEMGGAEYCYLVLSDDDVLERHAASHHALLLPEEQELHESLFRRSDGIMTLFATSTLAQGMNLPAELVVISSDRRFLPEADSRQYLEPHEILNSAGRAGRAGVSGFGMVLLVPSKVFGFSSLSDKVDENWRRIKSVFEKEDRCLVIDDPLRALLDRIHLGVTDSGTSYLINKLPFARTGAVKDEVSELLNRSLCAFRARGDGDEGWIRKRVKASFEFRERARLDKSVDWIENVSDAVGLRPARLQQIFNLLESGKFMGTGVDVVNDVLDWFEAEPGALSDVMKTGRFDSIFGKGSESALANDSGRKELIGRLRSLLLLWMTGSPLCDLENELVAEGKSLNKCERSRSFVRRVVPDIAFVCGLPGWLLSVHRAVNKDDRPIPVVLATLGRVVREGCDGPESLAVRLQFRTDGKSRVAARRYYDGLVSYIDSAKSDEVFEDTWKRIQNAIFKRLLSEFQLSIPRELE